MPEDAYFSACFSSGLEFITCDTNFTVVYLVAKSLIWSKNESNLVVVETSV